MTQHLAEISRHVADDAHAILIMDQAGWHMSNNLTIPRNISILPLPPKSPELNPVENLWHFMRKNWLSIGVVIPCLITPAARADAIFQSPEAGELRAAAISPITLRFGCDPIL